MMARCLGSSAVVLPVWPSRAAKGLEIGFGACTWVGAACACGDGACARACKARCGTPARRAPIEPVVRWMWWGRARGSGTFCNAEFDCASAGAAVRHASSAAKASVRPFRALWWSAITISASRP